MSVSTLERLTEYVDSRGASLRVDKSSAVIRGVKVLGARSKIRAIIGSHNRLESLLNSWSDVIELDGKPFFRTGDIGCYDKDGYFYMTDRVKRMINASGFKVWPAEVEALMHHHPQIKEACVIGAPDARRGETVKAYVVAATGTTPTEAEVIAWCHETMAAYKCPRQVVFVDALPKTGSGKVQWRELAEAEAAAQNDTKTGT